MSAYHENLNKQIADMRRGIQQLVSAYRSTGIGVISFSFVYALISFFFPDSFTMAPFYAFVSAHQIRCMDDIQELLEKKEKTLADLLQTQEDTIHAQ